MSISQFLDMSLGKLLLSALPFPVKMGTIIPVIESETNIYSQKSFPFLPGHAAR